MTSLANEPELLSRTEDGIAILTLNRPEARNALSVSLLGALRGEIERWSADPAIQVLIIAGNGPAFCAGHDLREIRALKSRERYEEVFARCSDLMRAIRRSPKPVIAQVHGIATAAGCQLVAGCDLAVAESGARFATPGVNIGLFCSTPAVSLSRAIARKPAMEMLLTGDLIDAAEARRLGLINRVVPAASLAAETLALARQIASKSSAVLALGKEAFYRQAELGFDEALRYASAVMVENLMQADAEEGIDAFLEKRKPHWHD
ncbi:MAG TPA: enoyl-CoA hydratase [Hypericibacter adhaerens]|jgi:enoyl-CoA hydratase/carnithine racemase|uniref:Enoyl-CoA hydratase domain-containing protein 3, mitochondrial n=1 Tax=Hypericibacter adhaerens TaxID=2602016 RepID=A0A5J6N6U3_9PROT|nr:enoyl-CoA hydratase [Hypericibacter adhaerens]QEX22666.1 enoyl-CoA hydratase [Hypericibacter adhaerens]HWA45423.1 enoyl-CoA hydratase [Hypericibacter adhaerens]